MRKLFLVLLMFLAIANAETFVKRFNYVMSCPYNEDSNTYLNNCLPSIEVSSIFIFNYKNTSDIFWKTDEFEHRLFNVGVVEASVNNNGDSVYVYDFISDNGDEIQIVWQGTWLRVVFKSIALYEFSNTSYESDDESGI